LRVHDSFRIDPLLLEESSSNPGLDREFFPELSNQSLFGRFVLFDFSAREFPLQRVPGITASLTSKHLPVLPDHADDDSFHCKRYRNSD
jgi:hypothetical protein